MLIMLHKSLLQMEIVFPISDRKKYMITPVIIYVNEKLFA